MFVINDEEIKQIMNRIKNWQSLKQYHDESYFDGDDKYQTSEPINPILDQEEAEVWLCQVE